MLYWMKRNCTLILSWVCILLLTVTAAAGSAETGGVHVKDMNSPGNRQNVEQSAVVLISGSGWRKDTQNLWVWSFHSRWGWLLLRLDCLQLHWLVIRWKRLMKDSEVSLVTFLSNSSTLTRTDSVFPFYVTYWGPWFPGSVTLSVSVEIRPVLRGTSYPQNSKLVMMIFFF